MSRWTQWSLALLILFNVVLTAALWLRGGWEAVAYFIFRR